MPVSSAPGAAFALDTAALPMSGVNTRALPTVPNSSRRLNLEFVKWSLMASRLQPYDITLPRKTVSAYRKWAHRTASVNERPPEGGVHGRSLTLAVLWRRSFTTQLRALRGQIGRASCRE